MGSSLTLRQQTEITGDSTYRVLETITDNVSIDPAVFVYRVGDSSFDHYASVPDLINYPDNRGSAVSDGLGFYRLEVSDRYWDDIDSANAQKQATRDRLALLVSQWDKYSAGFEADVTVVISND